MNIIKGLIIKDLSNIKSYKMTILFLLIIFSMTSFMNDTITTFMPVFITLCFGMMATSSFNYDNLANSDRYILSFPLNKKDIVKAKYIYIILFTLIGAIIGITLSIILQMIKTKEGVNMENIISTSIGALFGMMILQMFQIPIIYKFGAEKGRLIQMIGIVIIMIIGSSITVFFIKVSPFSLDEFLIMLEQYGLAIIGVVVVLLYLLSYKISLKIYNEKEI